MLEQLFALSAVIGGGAALGALVGRYLSSHEMPKVAEPPRPAPEPMPLGKLEAILAPYQPLPN